MQQPRGMSAASGMLENMDEVVAGSMADQPADGVPTGDATDLAAQLAAQLADATLRWIPAGVIPPCPCGAPTEDQVRRRDGGDRSHWHCLVCEQGRPVDPDWQDPLVAVTDAELRAITHRMEKRAAIRETRRNR